MDFWCGFGTSDLLTLSNPSFILFSWVPITWNWIEFVPMMLDVFVLSQICYFQRFPDPSLRYCMVLVNTSVLLTTMFQIGQRLSQWALMPRRPMQMDLVYLINFILYGLKHLELKYISVDQYHSGSKVGIWIPLEYFLT